MSDISIPEVPYLTDDDIRGKVQKQLDARSDSGENNERFMFRFECRAIYRYQAEASVEGYRFLSDEGRTPGGTEIGPAPLRYFVAGILIAVQVWVIKMAALAEIRILSLRCGADSYREAGSDEEFPEGRGFARIVLIFDVKTDWEGEDAVILKIIDDAVLACPAAVTASRGTNLTTKVIHNGKEIS